jgi:hypothetical protein
MRITASLLIVAGAALMGCVPWQVDYYLPEAPSGTLKFKRGECNDVKQVIAFGKDEQSARVEFVTWPLKAGSGALVLSVFKNGPADDVSTIDFASDTLTVIDAEGKMQKLMLELPQGSATHLELSKGKSWFEQSFKLPPEAGRAFDIDVPEIRIDGSALNIPRIHFTRKSMMTMQGINC